MAKTAKPTEQELELIERMRHGTRAEPYSPRPSDRATMARLYERGLVNTRGFWLEPDPAAVEAQRRDTQERRETTTADDQPARKKAATRPPEPPEEPVTRNDLRTPEDSAE